MLETLFLSMLLGGCAGLLSGLFGIGGGIVLVPFLAWLFYHQGIAGELTMLMAIATSLATIIITSTSAIWAHYRLGSLDWATVYRLIPGLTVGTMVGAAAADRLPADSLRLLFACYLFLVSIQLALDLHPRGSAAIRPSAWLLAGSGGIIGGISAILGIGGGTLTVPLLLKFRWPLTQAIAVSSACGFPIAVLGTLSYAYLGWHAEQLPPGSLGYVYVPAFLAIIVISPLGAAWGARLAHRLPTSRVKRGFALLLLVVGIKLLW